MENKLILNLKNKKLINFMIVIIKKKMILKYCKSIEIWYVKFLCWLIE